MSRPAEDPRNHYIHTLSYTARERLVGGFVLGAVFVIIGLLFVNNRTSHLFESRITFHAYLRNAQGVSIESVVKVSGIEVGRVTGLDITPDNRIQITLHVFERFRDLVRTDSRASLSKLSLLGKASIDITAGSVDAELLPNGATLAIEEPLSVDELMAQLTQLVEKVNRIVSGVSDVVAAVEPQTVRTTVDDLAATARDLRAVTAQVASGQGAVGRVLYSRDMERDIDRSLTTLAAVLEKADRRLAESEPLIRNATAAAGEGQATVQEVTALARDARALVGRLDGAVGSVAVDLQQLPELVTRMKLLLDTTERTMEGMQRVWPLSGAFPDTPAATVIDAGSRQ